jgi:hypothetical protein
MAQPHFSTLPEVAYEPGKIVCQAQEGKVAVGSTAFDGGVHSIRHVSQQPHRGWLRGIRRRRLLLVLAVFSVTVVAVILGCVVGIVVPQNKQYVFQERFFWCFRIH